MVLANFDLSEYSSLGLPMVAKYFIEVRDRSDIKSAFGFILKRNLPFFVLSGGSNAVFFDEFYEGVIVYMGRFEPNACSFSDGSDDEVVCNVSAGYSWPALVELSVKKGYWGFENLALIPGKVGAAPVQNIGAFGQEVSNTIESVDCFDYEGSRFVTLSNEDCKFDFRSSIFNESEKLKYLIVSVKFRLSRKPKPILCRSELAEFRGLSKDHPHIQKLIFKKICSYRSNGENLPNDSSSGNAGTFFKTASVSSLGEISCIAIRTGKTFGLRGALLVTLFALKYRRSGVYRLPSKRLIQLCELENLRFGGVALLPTNPAVVVTDLDGSSNRSHLERLIREVLITVYQKTGVKVPIEPVIVSTERKIGFDYYSDF